MVRINWFQRFYWERLAKPRTDRELFRTLIAHRTKSLLEVGVGDGQRMQNIAKLIGVLKLPQQLRYVGVDVFESSVDGQIHLTLKKAHQLAAQLGFRSTLIPGDACTALPRVAQKIGASDLVIINGGIDVSQPLTGPIGKWLLHITHAESAILACQQPGDTLRRVLITKTEARIAA